MEKQILKATPIILIGVLTQSLTILVSRGIGTQSLLTIISCMLLVLFPLLLHKRLGLKIFFLPAVTAACGGLGMILGSLVDEALGSTITHHTSNTSLFDILFTWTSLMMVVFCAVSCWLLCPNESSTISKTIFHGVCMFSMIYGMYLAMILYGYSLAAFLGHDGSIHILMLVGMMLGVGAVDIIRSCLRLLFIHENNSFSIRN